MNETAYDVSVAAKNAAGTGAATEAADNPVTPVPTPVATVSVARSPNATVFGQPLTLTATVAGSAGSPAPTGEVDFLDGTKTLASKVALAHGKASFETAALSVGTHQLTVRYAGDGVYPAATSFPEAEVVSQAGTTTALAASTATASFGTAVTLTSTVIAVSPGEGHPSGKVTFESGTTTLGSGAVTSATGVATLVVADLPVGDDPVTAVYGGDEDFAPSSNTTSVVEHVLKAVPTVRVHGRARRRAHRIPRRGHREGRATRSRPCDPERQGHPHHHQLEHA